MNSKINFKRKKFLLSLLVILIPLIAIPFTLIALQKFRLPLGEAAEYEAKLSLVPSNETSQVRLSQEELRLVQVFINTGLGEASEPAEVNSIEFKIYYDPLKIAIVNQAGENIEHLERDRIDSTFDFIAPDQDTVTNGEIHLAMASGAGSVSGTREIVSFYIKALTNNGSDTLQFATIPDSAMHAYQKIGQSPFPDILSATKMNNAPSSSLTVNFGSPNPPSLSLLTDSSNLSQGDTFDVRIDLDTAGQDIVGVDLVLEYDSNYLLITDTGITPGKIFASYSDLTVPEQTGTVTLDFSGWSLPESIPEPPFNGKDTFATIRFLADSIGQPTIHFVFAGYQQSTTDCNLLAYYQPGSAKQNSDDILSQVNDLTVNITTSPTPSPSLPPTGEIIIDNLDPGFSSTGDWRLYEEENPLHYNNSHHWTPVNQGNDGDVARWDFTVPQQGNYQISTYIWGCDDPNRCWRPEDAPYTITHEGGSQAVKVNQREVIKGWKTLGEFYFIAGKTYRITLTDAPITPVPGVPYTDKCDLMADAIRLVLTLVPSPLPTPSPSLYPSPPPDRCKNYPPDVSNGDNYISKDLVDSYDLAVIISGWGTKFRQWESPRIDTDTGCSRDLNRDSKVNVADIQILVSWWKIPYSGP